MCVLDEINHTYCENNMNNQNPKGESQNWRVHSYIQESRSHSVPRPQNYYTHYPPSQFINDYLHTGYVYPGLMPSYRSGEGSLSPSSAQIVNPLSILSSEDYAKYYNKIQNYIPQDPRHCIKAYPHHPPFYDPPHPYRTPHFHNMGLQNQNPFQPINSSIYTSLHHSPNHIAKVDKTTKNKGIIVIESDEENFASKFEIIKVPAQKKEEKQPAIEAELYQKKNPKSQEIEEEKKEITNKVTVSAGINLLTKEPFPFLQKEGQIKPQSVELPVVQKASPIGIDDKHIRQVIPMQMIDELRDEILQELEAADLPDQMMKIFLTYKTLDTYSKYHPDEEISLKVMNLLKIYRAIVQFEKQRKYFIQHLLQQQILKRFNYPIKVKINKNPSHQNAQKFCKLAQQLNWHLPFKTDTLIKGRNASNLLYPQKTKKISKRVFSDHNSQEISYNKNKITQKEPSQVLPSVACERRLRDRKKRKNKKQKYEKPYSENYFKDPSSREKEKLESYRPQKPHIKKQNGKVDLEFSQQDEGLIQKIQGWAQRTALAYAIEQKHKKTSKNSFVSENSFKNEVFKAPKKDEQKKYKERSSRASQNEFKLILNQKILQEKTQEESNMPNLMTFGTSNNLTEMEKEEFQRQMAHLTKELKNNENHGKIRIGKEYYQAKMPGFIQSQTELTILMRQKREKLMQRKMGVLTF